MRVEQVLDLKDRLHQFEKVANREAATSDTQRRTAYEACRQAALAERSAPFPDAEETVDFAG